MAPCKVSAPEISHFYVPNIKSIKSVTEEILPYPRTTIDTKGTLSPKSDSVVSEHVPEILCTAFALALRCYTLQGVQLSYRDISNTRNKSGYKEICLQPDEILKVEDLHNAVRQQFGQVPSRKDLPAETGSYQSLHTAIIFHGEMSPQFPRSDANSELELHAKYSPDGLTIWIECISSSIPGELAIHLADTIQQTFNLVINHPEVELEDADYLGPLNRRKIFDWNSSPPAAVVKCAHELFRERAALQPLASAIDSWDAQLTYAEVEDMSNRLAWMLHDVGVKAEVIVPLCFEKSAWYVVTMLAVLKAGGAFVPLDPAHPPARLYEIVNQVNAPVVLTTSKYHNLFTESAVRVIIVDAAFIQQQDAHLEDIQSITVTPENLAYLIFTSGSTGKPKGTMIQHQSFCSGGMHQGEAAQMGPHSRIFQFASYSFDVSILEILTGLIFGACICIPNEQLGRADIVQSMNDFRVNWAFLTPSVLKVLSLEQLPLLKTLVLGGESMSEADMRTWAGKVQLMNGYGPSECSVAATANTRLSPDSSPRNIGRAIGGLCWVTDPRNHNVLLPVGAVGELLIQGPIVARGYMNDPDKTAAVFIQSPAWLPADTPSLWNRFYKTGDLVRYDADGMIHFVGRKDHQVKLHGQRMELGEVEHHLWTDSLIRHGMALIPSAGVCNSRLVGVVSIHREFPISPGDNVQFGFQPIGHNLVAPDTRAISERLTQLLPTYMVPTVWIVLDDFPIMSSGKLDRKKVAQFVTEMSQEAFLHVMGGFDVSENEQPVSEAEILVQQMWAKILDIPEEQVGRNKTFLALGGDSIKAMAAMSEFRKLGITLTVSDLLRHDLSTLARMAEDLGATEIRNKDHLPVSHLQQTLLDASYRGYGNLHHAVLLELKHKRHIQRLIRCLDILVLSHPALTLQFKQQQDGVWVQSFKTHDEIEHPSYHLNVTHVASLQDIKPIVQLHQSSLDVPENPNLVISLMNVAGTQYLSIVAHVAAIDSISLSVIITHLDDLLQSDSETVVDECLRSREEFSDLWYNHLKAKSNTATLNHLTVLSSSEEAVYVEKLLELDVESSRLLSGPCNLKFDTNAEELLLAALLVSYEQNPHSNPSCVMVQGSTRPLAADSCHVGLFSTLRPVAVSLGDKAQVTYQLIRETKDQVRLSLTAKDSVEVPAGSTNLIFSHGCSGQQFNGSSLKQAMPSEPRNLGSLFSAQFHVTIYHDENHFRITASSTKVGDQVLSLFVDRYQQNITEIITLLANDSTREFTRIDFPLLGLDYSSVDRLNHQQIPHLGLKANQIEDIYPCSPLQQGILLSQARQHGSYDVSIAWEVVSSSSEDEPIDVTRLVSAWKDVVKLHPALRTIFCDSFGGEHPFVQIVLEAPEPRTLVKTCLFADIESVLREKINLQSDPLVPPHQFSVYVTSDKRILCRVDASHAIVDGVSKALILRDMKQAYAGVLASRGEGVKYSDFIRFITDSNLSSSVTFWKEQLAQVEPCYFPRLADADAARELKSIEVELDTTAKVLHDFCILHGVTLSTLLQTVWALVCRCYVSRDEICFGYLASGRDASIEGLVDMIGPTISILICRALFDESTTVLDALKRCQAGFLDSLSHQHCSLAEIQHSLGLAGMPLFNTGMSFQTMTAVDTDTRLADVGFKGLVVREPTESVAGTFSSILNSILKSPESIIGQLNVIGRYDLSQILSWNHKVPETCQSTIPDLVQRQIEATPYAIAIESKSGQMTYAEFGQLFSTLSQHLIRNGIGPGVFVPLTFEKSAWAIVSMLAVLRAGGAFVPLDPKTPVERLREVVHQIQANVVLTSPRHASNWEILVPTIISVDHTLFDRLESSITTCEETSIPAPHHDAYVIFTSGSTGTPKGCVIQHSAFCSGALAQGRLAGLGGPSSRVMQFASYSFDVSLLEILTSLMFGACVCVPDEEMGKDIARCIRDFAINWTFLTPSVLKLLQPADVPSLKTLVLGGEALSRGDILTWADTVQLYNGYGPSECSVAAAANPGLKSTTDPANIGRAVGGVLWVVDAKRPSRLLPIGAVGELLISGPILARGYLGAPEKTAAAFIEQPSFIPRSHVQERFYRTGDLVRYNEDGTVHFLGRLDGQVKIRGQRVELGEIEYNIKRDEHVHHALTLLPSHGPFRQQLLAVVSFKNTDFPASSENQAQLCFIPEECNPAATGIITNIANTISATLPIYMTPTFWLPVTRIPLLPSGKLDRKKVRAWVEGLDEATYERIATGGSSTTDRAPSTPAEHQLRRIWASVLNKHEEEISMERSFNSLGGDSISAMQVIAQCRDAQLAMSVKDLAQSPTIAQLALRVRPMDDLAQLVDEDLATPFNLSPQQTWEFGLKLAVI
ncbi:Nonribosomal peptide synthetases (NRPS) [Aspergillus tanneri]|uniref:Nonribosomal peptide synthetases (NRPS) n=1 Tax=Aspergillus tanneri TaxID=1220188 RepID=A0A5M9M7B6_9EURO|nr:Nonribosomal peptide synthetases (NRPS) [Aspergillus tanneri]KAA8642651.1 Nonribosomal peptide synthetases (NRPS) [Aspergillus tanneri]